MALPARLEEPDRLADNPKPEGYRYWRLATSRWYSWIMPPSRSRLRTAPLLTELDDVGGEGRVSRSPRCVTGSLILTVNAGRNLDS